MADFLGIDGVAPAVAAALIAAAATLSVTLLKALGWLISGPRDRRRQLYGQAYEDAMGWLEMVYRIRRRANTDEADRALVERFHTLQERINHHRGWLGSESKYLARSYCRLVDAIKRETEPLIQAAWDDDGRGPRIKTPNDDGHPNVEDESLRFLADVRLHLSIWPVLPRLLLVWRSREKKPKTKTALPPAASAAGKGASPS
ncbi:MAG TPA: hypothetical protein VNT54_00580 [Solirubrobacteraceae bacterium]|nr:hypothetical protein [Solirubrobacteraceae bacterium]